ncbi:tellurite resistance TerB family protein [Roseomonas sp. NAR14]|uniref:Tellurite resistance TerB family protein n=1 Tax=Roseomonas acroporae TaxID=2937791 RepID=A0A9X1Y6V3_9PROT|nr:tellurite resistance TerB family protein [Roseomonas acroporae]MCK8784207.1 tellurite resistance TerB family protein [Roseomonas acroporae]
MFDATRVLGSILESRGTPSADGRLQNAARSGDAGGLLQQVLSQIGGQGGAAGSASGGGLGGLLGGMLNRGQGAGQGGGQGGAPAGQGSGGGLLGEIAGMVRRGYENPRDELRRNNPAVMGGLGALAGAILGGGRGATGGGLMAVLGSLAYSAMQKQRAAEGQAPEPAPASLPGYQDAGDVQRKATLMLRAMIQAAKSDGRIDQDEMDRILGKLDEHGEDAEARDFVLREMRGPVDVEGLARQAQGPHEAAEIYAASLMAIEVDTQEERDYLARLAAALGLSREAVDHIHGTLGVRV